MIAIAREWANHGAVPGMLSGLAALVALALLFAFQQVVTGAVTQGALRRSLVTQLHAAHWQCQALRSARERQDCLSLIPLPATPARSGRAGNA